MRRVLLLVVLAIGVLTLTARQYMLVVHLNNYFSPYPRPAASLVAIPDVRPPHTIAE